VLGIFRLVRTTLSSGEADDTAKSMAWIAAIVYGANPNLIYMQATAMGESLYLALFIWAVAFFAEFCRGKTEALTKCGLCLAAACLTRYDGWFLAAVLVAAASVIVSLRRETSAHETSGRETRESEMPGGATKLSTQRTAVIKFALIAAAAPVFWLGYNAIVYRNPLEFANGPYSAKAIEHRTGTVNPAKGNLFAAASYFIKAAESNVGNANWPGRLWLALALAGSLATGFTGRGGTLLLLWIPLPFYALSVAYGSVPIFVPQWWPFSFYHVRYGLQLLPAFAVFVPLGFLFLVQKVATLPQIRAAWRRWAVAAMLLATLVLAASCYASIWRSDPVCYSEAAINARARVALDKQLADWMKWLPPNATLLLYLGEHSGALEEAAIPLRRVINEGNHRVWKQPKDSDGLWERALADPAAYADFVVAFEGDPVWTAARDRHLKALVEIHTTGQAAAVIFQGRAR